MPPRKKGKNRAQDEDEEDEEVDLEAIDAEMEVDEPARGKGRRGGGQTVLDEAVIKRKAGELARLALFSEAKRGVLKREEINKKVLAGNTRAFNVVFEAANKTLRSAFGYEMVELLSRAERDKLESSSHDKEGDDERKKANSGKQYIVRSILPADLIKLACKEDEDIQMQERQDFVPEELATGMIISWDSSESTSVAAYGVLFIILSLILVNGKAIADPLLRSQLNKLHLASGTQIEIGNSTLSKTINLDQYLTLLTRQAYLDRIKTGAGASGPTANKNKRVRGNAVAVQLGDDNAAEFEWRWGERAHAEISEEAVVDFMVDFMGESARRDNQRGDKLQKQVRRDLERAAGSELSTISSES